MWWAKKFRAAKLYEKNRNFAFTYYFVFICQGISELAKNKGYINEVKMT